MENIEGIIIINKEKGWTSHDVVNKVRQIVGVKKVGHTGTLDPNAEGVLPICIGNATKVCEYITDKQKEYIATINFGIVTDTQDLTGNILNQVDDFELDLVEVNKVISSFVGEYMQTPPIYSAVKVKGKKLYEYARSGETVKIPARKIVIKEIEILELNERSAKMRVVCGKGTYIRTLCHDIGKKLKVGAVMKDLVRTKSGNYDIEHALTLSELEEVVKQGKITDILYDTKSVFDNYPRLNVKDRSLKKLINGNKLSEEDIVQKIYDDVQSKTFAVYHQDDFYALYKAEVEDNMNVFKVQKMFKVGE